MPSQPTIQELSALWLQLYEAPISELENCRQLKSENVDKRLLLQSIPAPRQPSPRPLHLLHTILNKLPGPWPTFALISCHTRLLTYLPENMKTGDGGEFTWLLESTAKLVKTSYSSFSDFLYDDSRPALRTMKADKYISHRGLEKFVKSFQLPDNGKSKPTVAIALPNGPLLAATCIAVTTHYTTAPINPAAGAEQFRADVKQSRASFVLTTLADYAKLEINEWARQDGVKVFLIDWDEADDISIKHPDGQPLRCPAARREPNQAEDIGLILFTSGTSGTKKVVPLTVHSIISGIVFVIDSWGLNPDEVCLNMMPLYHV